MRSHPPVRPLVALVLLLATAPPPVAARGPATPAAPRPVPGTATDAHETRERWLMGTWFTVRAPQGPGVGEALDAALDTVASLEARLSNWRATSELSRLDASGGGAVSEPLAAVVDSALALATLTAGAFDPTSESLTLAWDLRGPGRVPDDRELAAALARVGHRRVRTGFDDAGGRQVDLGGTALDLGGIGKGFALDRAAAVLRARGLTGASLDAGGQRLELSDAPLVTWIASPTDRDRPAVQVLHRGGSLATSAQSERNVRAGGRRIGHVLDPATGRPVVTRASVTVWAPGATRADALSTALLVMGRDAARAFAAAHPGIGVLWLEPRGDRVAAHAWNLALAERAPFVRVADDAPLPAFTPTSLASPSPTPNGSRP